VLVMVLYFFEPMRLAARLLFQFEACVSVPVVVSSFFKNAPMHLMARRNDRLEPSVQDAGHTVTAGDYPIPNASPPRVRALRAAAIPLRGALAGALQSVPSFFQDAGHTVTAGGTLILQREPAEGSRVSKSLRALVPTNSAGFFK
jgi:hypothetical protein